MVAVYRFLSSAHLFSTMAKRKMGLKNVKLRPSVQKMLRKTKSPAAIKKKTPTHPQKMPAAKKRPPCFFFACGENTAQPKKKNACRKNVARSKSRVTLRAISLATTVAQNVFFYPNKCCAHATAQQLINALVSHVHAAYELYY